MKVLNLTPHALHVKCSDGSTLVVEPTAPPARCVQAQELQFVTHIDVPNVLTAFVVPVRRQTFGAVEGLPAPKDDVYIVVSRLVAEACPERADLLLPGPAIRDQEGRVVGCDGLSVL